MIRHHAESPERSVNHSESGGLIVAQFVGICGGRSYPSLLHRRARGISNGRGIRGRSSRRNFHHYGKARLDHLRADGFLCNGGVACPAAWGAIASTLRQTHPHALRAQRVDEEPQNRLRQVDMDYIFRWLELRFLTGEQGELFIPLPVAVHSPALPMTRMLLARFENCSDSEMRPPATSAVR